jgi:hypothetical protein
MLKIPSAPLLRRLLLYSMVLGCVWCGLVGCSREIRPPAGFAIIREHVIAAPHNIPPIHSELDYTVIRVDGAAFGREKVPFLVDM